MTTATEPAVGTRFGRLVVRSKPFNKLVKGGKQRLAVWTTCVCGERREVLVYNLLSGNTTSCGCYHKEQVSRRMIKHGATAGIYRNDRPRIYSIWKGMRERCGNPKAQNYKWYGGKGITVCKEWEEFQDFYDWALQHGYADGLELDRKDTDKGYISGNCRWVTKKANIRARDMFWSEDLDHALVFYAKMKNKNPYAVIEEAVTALLSREGVI